ncbi:MAG: acyl-CoA synthetase [Amaricoccus sp.]|uniref:acyl-CoA synthetase n=1 Tax=Amaricoccus sp. TaxID=1872485 RepID=UPI0033163D40
MIRIATLADTRAVEAEMPLERRWTARSLHEQLAETAGRFPDRPAISFQLKSGPGDRALTLTWAEFKAEVTRLANLLRRLGVGPGDSVAYVLPNGLEAPAALLAGATAGVVTPVNPLLSPDAMAGILREVGAKVVISLCPFPKSDVANTVAAALAEAPGVDYLLEVDLGRYLAPPLGWVARFLGKRPAHRHAAKVLDLRREMARERSDALDFAETFDDRFCARFHTGGTTGLPKIAQHRARGILYNGWCGSFYMFTEADVLMCPLPMFHVLGAYPILMSCLTSGAQLVMVTPQGYRGEGVFDSFWKLIERWKVSFLITVPTAAARLMRVKVNADVSTLRLAISGSAAMPVELFNRFEAATGVRVLEGYGMTEATCLVSINPPFGERKIGSVGLPFAYTDLRILRCDGAGRVTKVCGVDESGEICVRGPGVNTDVYADPEKNRGMLTEDGFLRTGDLGRLDADGYLWITGRAKDLIIRGGHNIDPAQIEEALMRHPDVTFVGAIGQPDAHSGEVPAVYVELAPGASATPEELLRFASDHVAEHAAVPKHLEVLPELPKTAIGKIFKPELRRRAIARVYGEALAAAGRPETVVEVAEDRRLGLVAVLAPGPGGPDDAGVAAVLDSFLTPWRWQGAEH